MGLDQSKNHSIDIDAAAKMTKNYRDQMKANDNIAVAFNKDAINQLMSQTGCEGLRMFFALGDDGKLTLVLVAVDANGDDMYQGKLMEWAIPCPPDCGAADPLNGMD